jgi:hypothetical protein
MAKKKTWVCKKEQHEKCNNVVLLSSVMTGVQGIQACACNCHKEKNVQA